MNITDFDKVIAMLNEGVQRGSIFVPEHYDWAKALSGVKSYISRMIASEKENENTILTGSPASLAGALKDMLTLGLSIEDKSCYLFKKSKKSDQYVLRRSYYGTQKVVRELYPDCQIFADVVYEGEAFDLGPFINGRPEKITHYPNLECMNKGQMVASYAVILDKDEKVIGYGILTANTLANIQAANGGNFVNPVWKTYPEEMAKKSAINRACKTLVYAIPSIQRNERTRELVSSFSRTADNDSLGEMDEESESEEAVEEAPGKNAVEKVLHKAQSTKKAASPVTEPVRPEAKPEVKAEAKPEIKAEEVQPMVKPNQNPPQEMEDWDEDFFKDSTPF